MSIEQLPSPDPEPQLREQLRVLRVRKVTVVTVVLVIVSTAMFLSFRQTPQYEATAKVLVKPSGVDQLLQEAAPSDLSLETERQAVLTTDVAQRARSILGSGPSADILLTHVSVDVPVDTVLLDITFTDVDPAFAQAAANAFATAYLQSKSDSIQAEIEAAREPLLGQIRTLKDQLANAQARLRDLGGPEADELQSEIDALTGNLFLRQSELAQLTGVPVSPGSLFQSASLPSEPSSPNHRLAAVMGLLVGLILGIVAAFVRDRLDDRIRGRSDLEDRLQTPVLGVIPRERRFHRRGGPSLAILRDAQGATAEGYRALRTSVLFATSKRHLRIVMIASASAGEGKTTTCANLAAAMAQAGQRVIAVSADLRNPTLHRFVHGTNETGLSNVLTDQVPLSRAIQTGNLEGIWLLASGPVPPNPAELLQSEGMVRCLATLAESFDLVLIDSPPILGVSDALGLIPNVDGVLFVADAASTTTAAVNDARAHLTRMGAVLLGAVLNRFDPKNSREATQYGYGYAYQQSAPARVSSAEGNGRSQRVERKRV